MKTYLFDTINRYKRFSEKLDVQTAICNKSWWVFNDSGEKELYIFNEDGTLDVSFGGRVTEGKWRYVSANKSIIVSANSESFMLDPAFIDNAIFALKLNGTDQYVFMIDENNTASFAPSTYKELMEYFEGKLNAILLLEKARLEAKEIEKQRIEEERIKKERAQLELYYQQKWIREKLPREVYERYKLIFNVIVFITLVLVLLLIVFFVLKLSSLIILISLFCLVISVFVILDNLVDEKCYNFLIDKKDISFSKEWEHTWKSKWLYNFELYKENVDLEEIKKMCLK